MANISIRTATPEDVEKLLDIYSYYVETSIYVDKDARKMGIGKMLYGELEKRLKAMNILNEMPVLHTQRLRMSILLTQV